MIVSAGTTGTTWSPLADLHCRCLRCVSLSASTLVAIHANRGVVCVATHSTVIRIRLRLAGMRRIPRMTSVNAREDDVIRRIDMAIRADRALMRNFEPRVIENCAEPRSGHPRCVATYAGRRIVCSDVIRHGGPIGLCICVIRLVASIAICGRITCRVVAADMAIRAGIDHRPDRASNSSARRQHVRTLEWEARCAVVKLSIRPGNRVMARRAHGRREAGGDVIRNTSADGLRARPCCLVAPVAVRVRRRERIVVVDMAVGAGVHLARRCHLVRTRQRPACRAVIENRRRPGNRVVAR